MGKLKFGLSLFDMSKMLLALLIISINIREPFFHTREIIFLLFLLTSVKYMDLINAKYTLILATIWFVTTSFNLLFPGSTIVINEGGFQTIIISVYLLLMCFCQKRYASTIIKSYIFVSTIVALITISVWIVCYLSDSTFWQLRTYFINQEARTGLSFMNLDYRAILGTRYLTVWYRTAPCMVCALSYCLIQRLEGKEKNTIRIPLLVAALMMSGTRANIISALLLVALYVMYKLRKRGFRLIVIILFGVAFAIAIEYAIRFLNDTGSASSAIKILDFKTYFDIYKSDPLRTLFFGWGCGSTFFSQGRQMIVNVTELSLLETIRRYGLLFAAVIMGVIWGLPLRAPILKEHNYDKIFYILSFSAYVMVAFTNPYLLDSVGFCALLFYNTWFRYGREIDNGEEKQWKRIDYINNTIAFQLQGRS